MPYGLRKRKTSVSYEDQDSTSDTSDSEVVPNYKALKKRPRITNEESDKRSGSHEGSDADHKKLNIAKESTKAAGKLHQQEEAASKIESKDANILNYVGSNRHNLTSVNATGLSHLQRLLYFDNPPVVTNSSIQSTMNDLQSTDPIPQAVQQQITNPNTLQAISDNDIFALSSILASRSSTLSNVLTSTHTFPSTVSHPATTTLLNENPPANQKPNISSSKSKTSDYSIPPSFSRSEQILQNTPASSASAFFSGAAAISGSSSFLLGHQPNTQAATYVPIPTEFVDLTLPMSESLTTQPSILSRYPFLPYSTYGSLGLSTSLFPLSYYPSLSSTFPVAEGPAMPKAEIKQKKPAKARASKRKTSVTPSSVAPALSTSTSHISSSSITKSEKSNHVSRDSPVIEKRATRYRKSATKDIIQRIDRAVSQRMYLVDRKEVSSHEHEFAVLGSTGNVYNVKIRRFPECNCPDFEKHKNFSTGHSIPCKHVLFIYLKVLKLERSSHIIYQTSLLQSELEALFARQVSNAVIANEQTIENYKVATGASSRTAKRSQTGLDESRKPIDGDCPICFEIMDPNKLDLLTWCRAQCGNNVHKDCFTRWSRASRGPDGATCVYCRCNWVESTKASGTNPKVLYKEGYMNLGNLQGLPSDRDHSSYYDGPRRGHSYGRYNRRSMYNCFDSDGESQDDDY